MRRALTATLALLVGTSLSAQDPVIKRSQPLTLTGEIVEIYSYKQKGGAGAHRARCRRLRSDLNHGCDDDADGTEGERSRDHGALPTSSCV